RALRAAVVATEGLAASSHEQIGGRLSELYAKATAADLSVPSLWATMSRIQEEALDFARLHQMAAEALARYEGADPTIYRYLGLQRRLLAIQASPEHKAIGSIAEICRALSGKARSAQKSGADWTPEIKAFSAQIEHLRRLVE